MPPSLFLKCCAPWQGLCLCCELRWRRFPGWPDPFSSEFRSGQPLHNVHQSCCSWFWHLHLITYAWFRWGCRLECFISSGIGLPDGLFKIFNKTYTLFPDPPDALQPRETERRVVLQTGVPKRIRPRSHSKRINGASKRKAKQAAANWPVTTKRKIWSTTQTKKIGSVLGSSENWPRPKTS